MTSSNVKTRAPLGAPRKNSPGGRPRIVGNVMGLRRLGLWLATLLVATYLVLGLVVPLFVTLGGSVDTDPLWGAYTDQLTSSALMATFAWTLLLAALATALTVIIGYPVAYAMTLMGGRVRAVFVVLLIFPFLTSFLVRTYAWIGLLGVNGPIIAAVHWLGGSTETYYGTSVGVLVALVNLFLPIVVLTCYVSMSRIDPSHLRAARTLGAKHLESFWRVYAPQTKSGVVSGGVLVFIGCVGMYATPALIGGPQDTTVVTLVVQQVTQGRYAVSPAYPAALTVILGAVVAVVLTLTSRTVRLGELLGLKSTHKRQTQRPSGRSRRQTHQGRNLWAVIRRIPAGSGRHHIVVRVMVGVAVLIIDVPFVYLIGMSFQPLPLLAFPTDQWSTTWYTQVFSDLQWKDAALQSLQIAVLATLIALAVGTFLALRTTKLRPFATRTVIATALLPLIVPSVMYATGIFNVFIKLDLIGNWIAIAVVHSVLAMPYVYVNVLNGLTSYDPRWDQAAESLGASPWRRLRKVTVPLLRPALITGAFLAALTSFEEFTVTLFMGGLTFQNLPLKYWVSAQQELSPALAVVGVLLTGFTIVVAALVVAGGYATRQASKILRRAS